MNVPQVSFAHAVAHFPCAAAMARAFGVSRASVSQWRANGYLPPLRALQFTNFKDELVAAATESPAALGAAANGTDVV